jgi:MFS family permease
MTVRTRRTGRTGRTGRKTGGLGRYIAAATLARGADGGGPVGAVLLAAAPSAHLAQPSLMGGLLATCLSAPHLLGPVVARRLDRARDGRRVLAVAFVLYGLAIAAAALAIGHVPVVLVALLIAVAGTCGPLLTGGLSSGLSGLVDSDERAQRRAQGWDGVTYGLGGTVGPAIVAALAATASPRIAVLVLAAAAVLAAAITLTMPRTEDAGVERADVPLVRQTLRMIAVHGPLRRVAYTTVVAAMSGGAVAVLTVSLSHELHAPGESGAFLTAAYGFGSLLGSLLVTAFPLTGEPERHVSRWAAAVGAAFAACALVPGIPLGVVGFGLVGMLGAPLFTATLAARTTYSPVGARAQVFVSMAGMKIAAAALGSALAGAFAGYGPRLLLVVGGALTVAAALGTVLERRATRRR